MTLGLINANPVVYARKETVAGSSNHLDSHPHHHDDEDQVDPLQIYQFVKDIRDPEHPYSLEQLGVLSEDSIVVHHHLPLITIAFTPTIQHCSLATVIGLCLRVKLQDCLPPHIKDPMYPYLVSILDDMLMVDIKVTPGSHADEESVNKQLNDKERVAAALESPNLRQLVDECVSSNELLP